MFSFFPEDDTVKISESQAGVGGGMFLGRGRLAKGASNSFYEIGDFHIGARIAAKGEQFVLKDADEFVLRFMERHPEIYPGEMGSGRLNRRVLIKSVFREGWS